jgi:hypothetical protein
MDFTGFVYTGPKVHVARMRDKKNAYIILVGKLEEKRPLGRSRHRRVDDIKMDVREIG